MTVLKRACSGFHVTADSSAHRERDLRPHPCTTCLPQTGHYVNNPPMYPLRPPKGPRSFQIRLLTMPPFSPEYSMPFPEISTTNLPSLR